MTRMLVAVLLLTAVIAGCNTMSGFGRDLERLGDKIEQKAERHR